MISTDQKHPLIFVKVHILATSNQEHAKKKLLAEMDENTAFVLIDFAMTFLS